jgi:hypothetical protein
VVYPAAGTIEMAADSLKSLSSTARERQHKELTCAMPDVSEDFQAGYELGLQTARVFLSGNPAAILAKVSF